METIRKLWQHLRAWLWMRRARAWAASYPQRDTPVDESREANYGDRL